MTLTPKSEEVVTKLLAALQVHPLFEHLATDLMSRKSGTLGNLRLVEPGHGCKVGCNHSCCRIQPYLDLDLCLCRVHRGDERDEVRQTSACDRGRGCR